MNRAIIWIIILFGLVYYSQQSILDTPPAKAATSTTLLTRAPSPTPLAKVLPPSSVPMRVTIIGDSLTVGAVEYWQTPTGMEVKIDAKTGRSLRQSQSLIKQTADATDAYIVALGTNDCAARLDDAALNSLIISSFTAGQAKPMILLTLGESGKIHDCAVRFNAAARRLADNIPGLELADWQAVIRDHPEWYGAIGDGIHLTHGGYKARAAWLRSQLGKS